MRWPRNKTNFKPKKLTNGKIEAARKTPTQCHGGDTSYEFADTNKISNRTRT